MSITVSSRKGIAKGLISLPSSKSESNRILILSALSGGMVSTENLSQARDTKILQAALDNHSREINIQDAGTAMRFLTAYYCVAGQHKVLTGSARMRERPIAILVAALRDIGFRIEYLKQEGFPPIEIFPADPHSLKREVSIAGNVSSQYISALMMIAPVLEHGLLIHFTTALASRPYIELTRKLLGDTGIVSEMTETDIRIAPQKFRQTSIQIAADWSSASYWFAVAALAQDAEIVLEKLSTDAAQGDKKIAEWSQYFGIIAEPSKQGLLLHSRNPINPTSSQNYDLHFDFTDHPDLAQTVIVLCAVKNIRATFSGLGSLRIKETDRIAALQNELQKFSVKLEEMNDGGFQLSGGFQMSHQTVKTYGDHRMAMAFAPLALLGNINIENPEVVEKSYPTFWEEMMKVGFDITQDE